MTDKLYQIGQIAERVGLSLRTVRYYEEVGLVVPAARSQGNFRLYDDDAIGRLLAIKQMKPLDFSLEDMREVLDLRARVRDGECSEEDLSQIRERLEMYSVVAKQRCLTLREQLDVAEAFALTLSEEIKLAEEAQPRAVDAKPRPGGGGPPGI